MQWLIQVLTSVQQFTKHSTSLIHSLSSLFSSPSSPSFQSSSSEESMNSALVGCFDLPFAAVLTTFTAFFFAPRWEALDLFADGPAFSLSSRFRFPRVTPASDRFFLGFPTASPFFSRSSSDAACMFSSAAVRRTHLHAPDFQASRSFQISMTLVTSDGLTNASRGQPTILTPCSNMIAFS